MLFMGTVIYRRNLFIPWLVSHMFIIIATILSFTNWTFMSFFIDLFVAIVFPLVAGLMLGLTMVMWRQVYHLFRVLREPEKEVLVVMEIETENQEVYNKKEPVSVKISSDLHK